VGSTSTLTKLMLCDIAGLASEALVS